MLGLAYEALPRTQIIKVFGEYVDFDALAAKPRKSISAKRLLQTSSTATTLRFFAPDELRALVGTGQLTPNLEHELVLLGIAHA